MMIASSRPSAIPRDTLIKATKDDPTLSSAIASLNTGTKSNDPGINQLLPEMTVSSDGLLLRDIRLVIPLKLTQQVIDIAHSGIKE